MDYSTLAKTAAPEPMKLCRQCHSDLNFVLGVLRCGTCGLPADAKLVYEKELPVNPKPAEIKKVEPVTSTAAVPVAATPVKRKG